MRRNDVIRAYEIGTVRRRPGKLMAAIDPKPDAELVVVLVDDDSPAAGQQLARLGLPRDCVVVSIERAGEVQLPHGDTRLLGHDRVTLLVKGSDPASVSRFFDSPVLET